MKELSPLAEKILIKFYCNGQHKQLNDHNHIGDAFELLEERQHFAEVIAELVEGGYIEKDLKGLYAITEEGKFYAQSHKD